MLLAGPSRSVPLAFAALSCILMSGCAGPKGRWNQAPLKFEPATPEVSWQDGLGYMACPDSGVDLRAAFEGVRAGHIRFSVKARNLRSSRFDLDPREFRLRHPIPPPDSVTRRSEYVFLETQAEPDTISLVALDPSQQLETVRRSLDGLEKEKNPYRAETSLGGAIFLGILEGLTETATAPKGETEAQARIRKDQEKRDLEEKRRADAEEWNDDHLRALERLRDEETLWRKFALARTTLEPGGSTHGLVVFPMDPWILESTHRWVILDTSKAGQEARARRDSLELARPFVSRLALPSGGSPCVLPFLQVRPPLPPNDGNWSDAPPRSLRK
jgi:hypothetical protein